MHTTQQRIIWITGASSGIGKALATTFSRNGDHVVLTARRKSELDSIAKQLRRGSASVEVIACDVRKENQIQNVAARILKKHRRLDILVNSAGVTSFKDFKSTTIPEFDQVLETNLRGAFVTTRAVLPAMLAKKKGMIINIISFAAKTTYTNSAAYSASKAGTEAMMNVLRAETRERGIKVVNVYPGAVLTPMWLRKHRKRYANVMVSPDDAARLIYEVSLQPPSVMVEELVIRPQIGDLRV